MAGGQTAARARAWGVALALLSALCFGGSGAFGKALIQAGLDPLETVWLRIGGAVVVLLPVVVLVGGAARLRAARAHVPALIAHGITGIAGCQVLYYLAASRLPVGVAILLEFTGPVLVLAWIRFGRRAPVHRSAVAGVAVAVAGLACVVEVWSGAGLDVIGVLAGLGAAGCQAAYFLVAERLAGRVDPLAMTAFGGVVAVVVLTPLAAPWALPWQVLASPIEVGARSMPGWVPVLWVVLVSTVLAYVAGAAAVHRLSAQVAGAIGYTEAIAATAAAWVLLGERLGPAQLAGGGVVLLGAFIAQRAATGGPGPVTAATRSVATAAADEAVAGGMAVPAPLSRPGAAARTSRAVPACTPGAVPVTAAGGS